jgi:hypothetical protein
MNRLLVSSDLTDATAARQEVEVWIAENECVVSGNGRQLTVFENGVAVREWILVERPMTTMTVTPEAESEGQEPFWRNWRLKAAGNRERGPEKVTVLYPAAA